MKTLTPQWPRLRLRTAACLIALGLSAPLFAQTHNHTASAAPAAETTAAARADRPAVKHADRNFLTKAAKSGMAEVEISRVAIERTATADLKNFAQMMVDDHTRANDELASLASARGVELPAKNTKEAEKWSKRDPKDFDRDYVKKMFSDHEDTLELFRKEARDGGDPELVEFARKTLPKLQQHFDRVTDLKKTIR